jgi:hypothetical protein
MSVEPKVPHFNYELKHFLNYDQNSFNCLWGFFLGFHPRRSKGINMSFGMSSRNGEGYMVRTRPLRVRRFTWDRMSRDRARVIPT